MLLATLFCAGLIRPGTALAQTGVPIVYVHNIMATPVQSSADGVPALKVRSLFSLLDGNSVPLNAEIDRVELQLGQDRYSATFGKPNGNLAISLLVDTSGTLAGTQDFRRMIEGLAKALDSMPENSLYTVIIFNSSVDVIQEFTNDKEAVRKQLLTTVNAKAGSKPCLNDGLLEAVRRVGQASTRSAVIAVTASDDACGRTTTQAVVDEARSSGTQIHVLGLNGYSISLAKLEEYTRPTTGLAYMRSPNDLLFGLGNLLSGLANQWEANWTLYPPKGDQTAGISVILKDTSVLNGKITFTSDKDYIPPPKIDLVGEVRSTPGSILVNLSIVNRARITALQARIIDKLTGKLSLDQLLPKVQDSLALPANALQKDGNYSLQILALDNQNNVLAKTQPHDFQFTPSPLQIGITAVSLPSVLSSNFIITVTTPSGDAAGIASFKVWLEAEQSNGPIPNTEIIQLPDRSLQIPAGDLPSGTYQVNAQALDGANQVIAAAVKPYKVVYERPSFVDQFLFSVGRSPIAVVGFLILAAFAVAALFFLVRFARSRSRVPVRVVEPALPDRVHYEPPQSDRSRVVVPLPSEQSQVMDRAGGPEPEITATLVAREPATLSFRASIRSTSYTLGRQPGNNGVLQVEAQSGVSARHAVIAYERGAWYIKDANSTNGTFVNGQKLPKGGRARLQDHMIIGLGPKVKLEFRTQA